MDSKPDWLSELEVIAGNQRWNYVGFIVRQQLIDTRGWSERLIDEFLEADLIETNPHNSFQMMRLYLLDKVFAVEQTDIFKIRFLEINQHKFDPLKYTYLPNMAKRLCNRQNKRQRIRNKHMRY